MDDDPLGLVFLVVVRSNEDDESGWLDHIFFLSSFFLWLKNAFGRNGQQILAMLSVFVVSCEKIVLH